MVSMLAQSIGLWVGALAIVFICPGRAETIGSQLFLTVKSENITKLNLQDVSSAYVIVTDIMISPEGQPLSLRDGASRVSTMDGLHEIGPGVQLLASFGGSTVPSELFSHLVENKSRRAAFVRNVINFVTNSGFGGVDIAWLYPTETDKENYGNLLKELRVACDKKKLVLTVTVPSHPSVIGRNYLVQDLESAANYVILCTSEFKKLKKTSLIAPLYPLKEGSSNSVDRHINAWKRAGLSGDKIVMVIQTNSLTYKLLQPNEYRLGTSVSRLKIRPFYKICQKLYSGSLEVFEETARCPYAFREQNWYSYENSKSIQEKVDYAVSHLLGGIGVFNYDEDDPLDVCGDGSYPITRMVQASLNANHQILPENSATVTQRSIDDADLDALEMEAQLSVLSNDSPEDMDIRINDDDDEDLFGHDKKASSHVTRQSPFMAPRFTSHKTITTTNTVRRPVLLPPCGCKDEDISEEEFGSVILANSDQAFVKQNSPLDGSSVLFSESDVPSSYGPLFSEHEPDVRIQPVPHCAKFDPERSRIGIIATASAGVSPSLQPYRPQQPLTNIVATATYQTTAAPIQLLTDTNNMSQLLSLLNNQIIQSTQTVCPYDGIIPDPRNPRYYYLCRQGLPMSEENRFACADGYVFNPVSQKCSPLV
ncbi:chitinase-3-like protein 2 [Malaya genurostris]|uniref:chitinase-3-like protein 2 n=1 Tax=Malaya genurostris TaxID=325434 RepID=UPI0026F3C988|nr:chitinase-3-like protein 2 [Malaya genurostris]